eukprot:scaffold12190_cov120-Isochrysis_galbana.AAC.5
MTSWVYLVVVFSCEFVCSSCASSGCAATKTHNTPAHSTAQTTRQLPQIVAVATLPRGDARAPTADTAPCFPRRARASWQCSARLRRAQRIIRRRLRAKSTTMPVGRTTENAPHTLDAVARAYGDRRRATRVDWCRQASAGGSGSRLDHVDDIPRLPGLACRPLGGTTVRC